VRFYVYLTVRPGEVERGVADHQVREKIFSALGLPLIPKVAAKIEVIIRRKDGVDETTPITENTEFLLAGTQWPARANFIVRFEHFENLVIEK
jgi:hypothetical protein